MANAAISLERDVCLTNNIGLASRTDLSLTQEAYKVLSKGLHPLEYCSVSQRINLEQQEKETRHLINMQELPGAEARRWFTRICRSGGSLARLACRPLSNDTYSLNRPLGGGMTCYTVINSRYRIFHYFVYAGWRPKEVYSCSCEI